MIGDGYTEQVRGVLDGIAVDAWPDRLRARSLDGAGAGKELAKLRAEPVALAEQAASGDPPAIESLD
ncbi:hypothetical protein WMF37_05765 [Sorangium sp. So ce291]|uniref:hypothetical protein n=1 Tax=Sorangium sp. So ce291 TaxID=3133294 RepID=UPI003F62DF01